MVVYASLFAAVTEFVIVFCLCVFSLLVEAKSTINVKYATRVEVKKGPFYSGSLGTTVVVN
jgi:hypothetical protein